MTEQKTLKQRLREHPAVCGAENTPATIQCVKDWLTQKRQKIKNSYNLIPEEEYRKMLFIDELLEELSH